MELTEKQTSEKLQEISKKDAEISKKEKELEIVKGLQKSMAEKMKVNSDQNSNKNSMISAREEELKQIKESHQNDLQAL